MEDFDFKLQNTKDKCSKNKIIKTFLSLFASFTSLLILLLVVKKCNHKTVEENITNVVLIKSDVKSIKRIPENDSGVAIENLDISVYDIIDNTENNEKDLVIQKTEQNVLLDTNSTKIDEYFIDDQIKSINSIEEQNIVENNSNNALQITENDNNNNIKTPNIVLNNNDINKENINNNNDDILKLGNKSLIKNIKENKDIKPGIKVQILALSNKDSLIQYWEDIKNKYTSLLSDKNYYIKKININNSTIYRLQIGNFLDNNSAENFCKKYIELTNKNKIDCIVLKND